VERPVTIARLYALQQVDTALAAAVAHRRRLNDGTPQREALAAAGTRLEELSMAIAAARARQRTLELETQTLRTQRARLEVDMYSGRINNPKELAAMQSDAAAIGRHIGHLEDETLGLLEQVEVLEAQRRETQAEVEAAQLALARAREEFARASASLDQEIAQLTARRQELAADMDEVLLRRYERLRESKGGIAVVAVRQGACDGCHVIVPQRLLSRLERDTDLIAACDRCGRLLVVLPEG
jgi:predicted  nucleic acid-binding Zn-ribbon protein